MNIKISPEFDILEQKGKLSYLYKPFKNYQTSVDLYKVEQYLIPKGKAIDSRNGLLLTKYDDNWINSNNERVQSQFVIVPTDEDLYAVAGSLIELDTQQLQFDLNHPVDIEVQPSYDGSVNLILNDGKNIPRLINSRFSPREKNTYEIIDRIGENDTNVYSSDSFDKDTSLYYQYSVNPSIKFNKFINGELPVGQYCFYITYCDADENESDYIAESNLIPVYIGDSSAIDGGIKNQNSTKGISLKINNLDSSYNYLKIYLFRYFADYNQNRVFELKKLNLKYPIVSNIVNILIIGNEFGEILDPNILNISRFNPQSILTQALCKNMLFFGNIVKTTDNYKELADCALRIVPSIIEESNISEDYYKNILNIYNKVGYSPREFYRFGVVFIYNNGTLSNVYNTLGGVLNTLSSSLKIDKAPIYEQEPDNIILNRLYIKSDEYGWYLQSDKNINITGEYINTKGVCYINTTDTNKIVGIKFEIDKDTINYLKENFNIRGFFIVRQKRIPRVLGQCFVMPMDEVLQAPVIFCNKKYYSERFIMDNSKISNDYDKRLYEYKNGSVNESGSISLLAYAGICPDFLLNLSYYNQLFNGSDFILQKVSNNTLKQLPNHRFYNAETTYNQSDKNNIVKIVSVTENSETVAIKDKIYRKKIGNADEAYRFRFLESEMTEDDGKYRTKYTNVARGIYSPYLAIYSEQPLEVNAIYNILLNDNKDLNSLFLSRMLSTDSYYSISDRQNFSDLYQNLITCFKGDSYINSFSYRLNRNFNDASLPNNDTIIDPETWDHDYWMEVSEEGETYYAPAVSSYEDDDGNTRGWSNIILSDINAVQLGSWITFNVRSNINYNLRSIDHSFVSEEATMGNPRSYYPRTTFMYFGAFKMPDSYLYNDAYRASLGYKCYFALNDVNYLKNTFSNRIQYSAVAIQESFKNNYRYSLSTYYRDYSTEYGGITKLIGFEGYLLVVFEHAVGVAVINERVLMENGGGLPVFINTGNVLPEELTIISDTLGSLWTESIIKTEAGYVYGVDTIAKKIWRIKGQAIEILSDFKVNKFLVDNISLGERELYPIIGLKNVKTHYNNNKKDVMFTFYDDVYKDEEKVWNLCYNELLGTFITFYSWVPSYSENIDTQYFSFDRNTSKLLSLLAKSNYHIKSNTGILLESPILKKKELIEEELVEFGVRIGNILRKYYSTSLYIDKRLEDSGNYYSLDIEMPQISNFPEDWIITDNSITVNGYTYYANTKVDFSCFPDQIILSTDFEPYHEDVHIEYKQEGGNWYWYIGGHKLIHESNGIIYYNSEHSLLFYIIDDGTFIRNNLIKNVTLQIFFKNYIYYTELKYKDNQDIRFNLEKDHFLNYKYANLEENVLYVNPNLFNDKDIVQFTISATITDNNITSKETASVAVTIEEKLKDLTTDFYLHGTSGIIDSLEELKPCYWYGKQHPFEFEFVVNDNPGILKIFSNLLIISNKAEPESFHFEIEGDNYEFSNDKRAMYIRLEMTKETYLNLGSDILFDRSYKKAVLGTGEETYRVGNKYPTYMLNLTLQIKSTIFPLYYERVDTYNEIEHSYYEMIGENYDFKNLSGSEIKWNKSLNQFNIVTHIKNTVIDNYGRLRGNSRYKEGKWNVQIPSIIFNLKNESSWENAIYIDEDKKFLYPVPPIVINSLYIPKDVTSRDLNYSVLPNIFDSRQDIRKYVDTSSWTARKEARIRDKWMKVRIRYSGKNLAVILNVVTLFNVSYS